MTVYTCILNEHDHLHVPEVLPMGCQWLCYTDNNIPCPHPWQLRPAWTGVDPRRDSRIPKILSHLHTDSEFSLWLDGCFRQRVDPADLAFKYLHGGYDIALFKHPARANLVDELALCKKASIGQYETMAPQVQRYLDDGMPPMLFAGGFILRRNNSAVRKFNELWWKEYQHGSERDQFSLAYSIWKSGIAVNVIDLNILECDLFEFMFHAGFTRLKVNPQLEPGRQSAMTRRRELQEAMRR